MKINEVDPNGIGQHENGAKVDAGKMQGRLLLDFNLALRAVGIVATKGATKYTPHGWLEVEDGYDRYTDAMVRHLLAGDGYDDSDGGIGTLHDIQVAWNALARLQLKLQQFKDQKIPVALNPEIFL